MENIIHLEKGPSTWWRTAKEKLKAEEELEIFELSKLSESNKLSNRGIPLANEVRLKYGALENELEGLASLFGDRQAAVAAIDGQLAHEPDYNRQVMLQTLRQFLDVAAKPVKPAVETEMETTIKRQAA